MSHDMFEPNVEEFGARYPALMLADIGDAEFYARLVAGTRHVLRYDRADSCDRIADVITLLDSCVGVEQGLAHGGRGRLHLYQGVNGQHDVVGDVQEFRCFLDLSLFLG